MIKNEIYENGLCVYAEIYNLETKNFSKEEFGIEIFSRPMTREEWLMYGPQPLDKFGSLITLLVINGILSLSEASAVSNLSEESLTLEAQGWAAAEAGL